MMKRSSQKIQYVEHSARWVSNWLFFVFCLVIMMIVIGGATRLTNSGLSITEWLPIRGAIPPLSDASWLVEFEKYKKIPEFTAEHPDMEMSGFKFIYFMEWGHRQLGRIIGLAYGLPFLWLLFRRQLPAGQASRFVLILLLIGLQGTIGWWMVHSGLQDDRVSVSQYRLATHLGVAFIILGLLYWNWKDSRDGWPSKTQKVSFKRRTTMLTSLVYLQIISGAFVAGTQAGKSYNSWPLMDGGIVPDGYFIMSPVWRNIFENIPAIQFNHRLLAYIVLAVTIWVFLSTRGRHIAVHKKMRALIAIVSVQVILGIWTLISGAQLSLSLLHQFTAIFVFLASLAAMRQSRMQ
ncbi:MAG: COX15/CtaA family protein [Maricaulaceae bacterium]